VLSLIFLSFFTVRIFQSYEDISWKIESIRSMIWNQIDLEFIIILFNRFKISYQISELQNMSNEIIEISSISNSIFDCHHFDQMII
jgi:hypothetical protein